MLSGYYSKVEYKSRANILILHHFLIFTLLLCALLYGLKPADADKFIYPLCIMVVGIFAWCFWSWFNVTRSLLDPYTLFLASTFLFIGSSALLHLFGIGFDDLLGVHFPADLLATSLYFVAIGIAAFHYGALFAVSNKKDSCNFKLGLKIDEKLNKSINAVGWALIAISLVPFIFFMREQLMVVKESAYQGLFQREAATGYGAWQNVISGFLVPGIFFILIGGVNKRSNRIAATVIMSLYCTLYLYTGSRNKALLPLVVFLWLWGKYVARFKKITIVFIVVVILVAMFFIFPLVKAFRAIPGKRRTTLEVYLESWQTIKNPWIESFKEMGGTFRTVPYTISMIPSDRPYDYGASYLYSLFTIIPNFFWKVHPTIMRGTLSDWLINEVNPYIAAMGGGYGFSFIAETYANFGWYGFIVLLLFGLFLGYLARKVISEENPLLLVFVASFLSQAMFFVRGESALLVRSIVWYALLPTIAAYMLHESMKVNRIGSSP